MTTVTGFAQNKTVSGIVVDKAGEAVIGASVLVKGTSNGTITDFDGKFTLSNVPEKGIITITYIGYEGQDISIAGKNTLKVILAEDTETLDEVVVVGYGTQKKTDLTGSVMSVKSEDITSVTANNPVQALQGRVTGVSVVTDSRPGKSPTLRIRGKVLSVQEMIPCM